MIPDMTRVRETMAIAMAQIMNEVGLSTVLSWGVTRFHCTIFNGMPTMVLRVRGFLHDGYVYVSLNEGKDLYEIRLTDKENNVTKTITDIYGDMLGSFIDENVERGGMTEAECRQRCLNAILN